MKSARRGLCDRVFGLGAGAVPPDDATVTFRATMLARLDPDLRSCLEDESHAQEAERFFDDLYVPLAAIPGFLKALRTAQGLNWPHLTWVQVPRVPARLAKQRLSRLFAKLASLAVTVDLDAEEAVADLARADLAAQLSSACRPGG